MTDTLTFPDRSAFRQWLDTYGATSAGVWLLFGKGGGPATLTAHEALEEALCFGWIDGRMQRIDATCYKKYFARRTPKSKWSDKNKKLAQALLDRGVVAPAGRDAIAEAKRRGEWGKPARAAVGDDQIRHFIGLIQDHEQAYQNLMAMPPSVHKTYAGFYHDAKQDQTRQARLMKIIDRLSKNLKPM